MRRRRSTIRGSSSSSHQHGWFCMEQESPPPPSSSSTATKDPPTKLKNGGDQPRLIVVASSVSELSYGVGYYLRYYCNVTLGWDRVGGSVRNVSLISSDTTTTTTTTTTTANSSTDQDWHWPVVSQPIQKYRRVPWSYLMNVCTHSYSLVWYDWSAWEAFLDWASLMGINNVLACKLSS